MQATIIKRQMRARPEYRGKVMVDVKISYPQVMTRGTPAGAKISAFYSEGASAHYSYATHELYNTAVTEYINDRKSGAPFRTYTAMSVYQVPYNQNDYLSIYTDAYEFTGGAHGNTLRSAQTWNLTTGRRMQLGDFFSNQSYQSVIFGNISAQINDQLSKGMNIYLEGWQKNIFKYFDERNFYLMPEGIAVFYPLYTIAPYVSGIVTFIIPYANFDGALLFKP
jgi:hypothetical protein